MFKRSIATFFIVTFIAVAVAFFAYPGNAAPNGTITGTIFSDIDSDGVKDATEVGVPGVTITAYNATGTAGSAVSGANGTYTLSTTGSGPYRLEFTDVPVGFEPSRVQAGSNGTSVQFVTDGATADYALLLACEYCQADPKLVTPIHRNGTGSTANGLVSIPFASSSNTTPAETVIDSTANVGSVWGEAYARISKTLYVSSFLKRHVAFADSPGHVYIYDATGGSVTPNGSFTLQGVNPTNGGAPIDLGSVCRQSLTDGDPNESCDPLTLAASRYTLPATVTSPNWDMDAFAKVGKISYGDIDVTEDEKQLWLVNLFQQALISVDISTGTPNLAAVQQFPIANIGNVPTCTGGELRPWALEFYADRGYLGLVCDAGASFNLADMHAYIVSFAPDNMGAGFAAVVDFPLDYGLQTTATTEHWLPWATTWAQVSSAAWDSGVGGTGDIVPQALVGDIEFTKDGSLVVGMLDRYGHMVGSPNYIPNPAVATTNLFQSYGDLIKFCNVGGTLTMEGQPGCAVTPTGTTFSNPGISGAGEYYIDRRGDGGYEGFMGSLAYHAGLGQFAAPWIDPEPVGYASNGLTFRGGIEWFNEAPSARHTDYYVLYGSGLPTFGKVSGLGDLEMLCDPAPLEVGNRVWNDADQDGAQDPAESPLSGITVNLWDGAMTTILSTTVTAAEGEYYFSVEPNTNYCVKVDTTQPALAGFTLTGANTVTDTIDSDGVLDGTLAAYCFITGAAGQSDHTIDFGFFGATAPTPTATATAIVTPTLTNTPIAPTPTPTATPVGPTPTPTVTPTPIPGLVSYGNYVWYDDDKDGQQEGTEAPVPGVKMCAETAAGVPVLDGAGKPLCSVTDNNGLYLFRDLQPGNYCSRFDLTTLPAGYAVTVQNTLTNTVDTIDSDANPATGLACETGAIPGGGQNLDVDMGINKIHACIGNYVWHDSNINGIQELTEEPFPNAIAELFTRAGVSTGITDTTGIDGAYLLCAEAGQYYVQFTLPGSANASPSNQGGDDAKDSDIDPATLRTAVITLPAVNPDDLTFDVGVYLPTGIDDGNEPTQKRVLLPLIRQR